MDCFLPCVGPFFTIWTCAGTKPMDRRLDSSTVIFVFAIVLLLYMLQMATLHKTTTDALFSTFF